MGKAENEGFPETWFSRWTLDIVTGEHVYHSA